MFIEIQHRYLVFPVDSSAPQVKFCFFENGKEVYHLYIKYAPEHPTFSAYANMEQYIGKTIELKTQPETEPTYTVADSMDIPGLYKEDYRPVVHFTTKNGWLNDPNGLVYCNGEYHMFYQHNPCGNQWFNMHWGHAISRDLIRWHEVGTALAPDNYGEIYSGNAIADKDDLLGLKQNENDTIAFFYTGTSPLAQYLAYSTDGLKTFQKHGEPVVAPINNTNTDPKVIFCEEWNMYIMSLFLENDTFGILRSADLLHWQLAQTLRIDGDYECPDIFPMVANDGIRKWVMIGAKSHYLIGDITADAFVATQTPFPLSHCGSNYAGHTFSELPDKRIVRMDWLKWNTERFPINGQMSIPYDLSLEKHGDRYYLCANPVEELVTIYEKDILFENVEVSPENCFTLPLESKPHVLKLCCPYTNAEIDLNIFGTALHLNMKENQLTFGVDKTSPITHVSTRLELTLITDIFTTELYLDGGKIYTCLADCEPALNDAPARLEIRANGPIQIEQLELHSLKNIWE